jgi:hypothetical protein
MLRLEKEVNYQIWCARITTKCIHCIVASREFVDIDNTTYFIDITGIHRDDAKSVCESVNMTMISFEGDEQKWYSVNRWLNENGTHANSS